MVLNFLHFVGMMTRLTKYFCHFERFGNKIICTRKPADGSGIRQCRNHQHGYMSSGRIIFRAGTYICVLCTCNQYVKHHQINLVIFKISSTGSYLFVTITAKPLCLSFMLSIKPISFSSSTIKTVTTFGIYKFQLIILR